MFTTRHPVSRSQPFNQLEGFTCRLLTVTQQGPGFLAMISISTNSAVSASLTRYGYQNVLLIPPHFLAQEQPSSGD
jgi:hypothetical protein